MNHLPRKPPAKTKYPVLEREIEKRYKRIRLEIACTLDMNFDTFVSKMKKGNIRIQEAIRIQKEFFPDIPIDKLFTYEE